MKNITLKYTKRLLFIAILLGGAMQAMCAPTASQIMDKVVKALNDAPSLAVRMSILNGNTGSYEANLLMSGQNFKYTVGGLTVYFDGLTQWTVDNEAKEVSVTEPTADEIAETNPLAFVNNYSKNYKVNYVSESNGTYTVRLTALKKSSYVRSAQVVVSGTTWLPTHITAQLSSGQTLTVRITSAVTGKALAKGDFKFDAKKSPGLEVIDLR